MGHPAEVVVYFTSAFTISRLRENENPFRRFPSAQIHLHSFETTPTMPPWTVFILLPRFTRGDSLSPARMRGLDVNEPPRACGVCCREV